MQKVSEFSNKKELYTAFDESVKNLDYTSDITLSKALYEETQRLYRYSYSTLFISVILASIEVVYLIYAVGHVKNKKGIYLSWVDKIPLEIIGLIYAILIPIECIVLAGCFTIVSVDVNLCFMLLAIVGYFSAISVLYGGGTFIKRIKTHTFFNFLHPSFFLFFLCSLLSAYKNLRI